MLARDPFAVDRLQFGDGHPEVRRPFTTGNDGATDEQQPAFAATAEPIPKRLEDGRQWEALVAPAFGGVVEFGHVGHEQPFVEEVFAEQVAGFGGPQAEADQWREHPEFEIVAGAEEVRRHRHRDVGLGQRVAAQDGAGFAGAEEGVLGALR